MIDYTKHFPQRNDQELFKHFVSSTKDAFQEYKNGSNINRALLKCEFKPKVASEAEKKI